MAGSDQDTNEHSSSPVERPSSRGVGLEVKWWAHQDLNLGPIDYESTALTN